MAKWLPHTDVVKPTKYITGSTPVLTANKKNMHTKEYCLGNKGKAFCPLRRECNHYVSAFRQKVTEKDAFFSAIFVEEPKKVSCTKFSKIEPNSVSNKA